MAPTKADVQLRESQRGSFSDVSWPLTTYQVMKLTGVTYRQAHRYVERGFIVPVVPPAGSGSQMLWGRDDVRTLLVLDALAHELQIRGGAHPRTRHDAAGRSGLRDLAPAIRAAIAAAPDADAVTVETGRCAVTVRIEPRATS